MALKILQRSGDRRSEVEQRFLREARIIAKLESDHVVRVLDVNTSNDPPYLAMELLDGETVEALLETRKRLDVLLALRIVAQACRGVADAHALGVIHRDLKPSNLVLARTTDGALRVKVIDFGISKPILREIDDASLTATGEVVGSPVYMAPEQLRSGGPADPRSDIWALGTILYELVTGVAPFDDPSIGKTLQRILAEEPKAMSALVPDVPASVAALVAACLSKDVVRRPQTAQALLEELEELEAMNVPGALPA